MKRFTAVLLMLALAAGMFSACATQEGGASADSEVTLKWALWDEHLTTYYAPLMDAYKAKNPNVKFETVDLGSADFMTQMLIQLSGGEVFDLLTIKDMPGYANLISQNRIEPLDAYIDEAGINTDDFGGLVEQLSKDGEVYTLPFRSDLWLIYYNKDLFDAAGVDYPDNDMTLDEYVEIAAAVTSGEGANKVYGNHYHTWRSATSLFGVLDGKNSIVEGNYDFLAPTYEWILAQQNDGICMDYAHLKTSGSHYSGIFFNNQIAMMNMGSWFIATQIQKINEGESLSKNWGVVKYPHPEGTPAGATLGTITGLSVGAASKNKDVAFDFVNFCSGPEGAAILAGLGQFPAQMSDAVAEIIAAVDGFPQDENSAAALVGNSPVLEMPLHAKAAEIEVVLNEVHDNIMLGNISVEDGVEQMNTRVSEILK